MQRSPYRIGAVLSAAVSLNYVWELAERIFSGDRIDIELKGERASGSGVAWRGPHG